MSTTLNVIGGMTAEQFLNEYWQKKPLLVRNALPEIIHLLEPQDIIELALEEHVSARLIRQEDRDPQQWYVKSSPLMKDDFQKLPKLWTLLVQAVDHHSLDVAELWKKFPFIPQWRRDDIMVSYAPQGGSVGQHFDYYDVFLVQGYGHRRWQLGQMCDMHTRYIAGQPLKLLTEMKVNFDEILAPGDLLYVPPGLAHYGVAEDQCLTFSFGFRMPHIAEMMDRVSDKFAEHTELKKPLSDSLRQHVNPVGKVSSSELSYLKAELLQQLQHSALLDDALMSLISEAKYPENIPESAEITVDDLITAQQQNYQIILEPASRLLYTRQKNDIVFWANGEQIVISEYFAPLLKQLADGQTIELNENLNHQDILEDLTRLINDAILILLPPDSSMF